MNVTSPLNHPSPSPSTSTTHTPGLSTITLASIPLRDEPLRDEPPSLHGGNRGGRILLAASAIAIAALGFLPLPLLLSASLRGPVKSIGFRELASGWLTGTAIAAGMGIALAILSRSIPALWRENALAAPRQWWRDMPLRVTAAMAILALALYVTIALRVFDGKPLIIDEIVQLLQAQIFSEGRLWRQVSAYPEFFSIYHMVDTQGRVYSQFPPGGPALLALGVLAGAPWLVGPLCAAVAVAAWAVTLRTVEPRAGVAIGAVMLFAAAPFVAFMAGTYMNHVQTLMWITIAAAALARVMTSTSPRPALGALSGFALGAAATVRPVDALAFAVPAAAWYLTRAIRDRRRVRDALAATAGVAAPIALLLWFNWRTTGSPTLFGYEVLWGTAHSLGFHLDPSGEAHTPARGLAYLNRYLLGMQTHLFETPVPSLLPVVAALAIARRASAFDRYLLAATGLLAALYAAYWFNGEYLGPRFLYPLAPILALWTARLPALVRERWSACTPHRATVYTYATAGALATVIPLGTAIPAIPFRATVYASSYRAMRWDADSGAAAAGVQHALVFVRESWGTQVVARMWAAGISRSQAAFLYRRIDTCMLDEGVSELERDGTFGARAEAAIRPLLRDSASVIASPYSMLTQERVLPGYPYSASCVQRIAEDREAFTVLSLLLPQSGGGNIYARDLNARNALLALAHPAREVYSLRPDPARDFTGLFFFPVARDSLLALGEK